MAEKELDELECVLGNLIYGKYIRGYIEHGKAVILLKKEKGGGMRPMREAQNITKLFR